MPQLIPDPWFFILSISWLILIFLAPKKILFYSSLNNPNSMDIKMKSPTWNWPW